MRLVVAVVGKPRDRHLAAAIEEYETRAARYWPLEVAEVREASGRGVHPADVRSREGERLLERVPPSARLVACDERGDRLTSAQFATLLAEARDHAQDVAFVIGGAFGLPDVVRDRATRTIQMAPWTLPHELARLVLAEQLYRAGTIARGEPYHK
ncbi:MAG TPA: 23S rRNA (pseudouridine(1915)-N(3))-methyltransferase RlmH [Gemmatimonadaceae bacterium]|nr:23S rRNA (pseudouridine(1915)-N(3))-methyltransferase RlmH [Gemmatimonadaceae bacterium]